MCAVQELGEGDEDIVLVDRAPPMQLSHTLLADVVSFLIEGRCCAPDGPSITAYDLMLQCPSYSKRVADFLFDTGHETGKWVLLIVGWKS